MIRLTLVTNALRGTPEEFATDDLGEALTEYGRRHFAGGPPNSGPEKWIVAFVVENGEARMTRDEAVRELSQIASVEKFRAARETSG